MPILLFIATFQSEYDSIACTLNVSPTDAGVIMNEIPVEDVNPPSECSQEGNAVDSMKDFDVDKPLTPCMTTPPPPVETLDIIDANEMDSQPINEIAEAISPNLIDKIDTPVEISDETHDPAIPKSTPSPRNLPPLNEDVNEDGVIGVRYTKIENDKSPVGR